MKIVFLVIIGILLVVYLISIISAISTKILSINTHLIALITMFFVTSLSGYTLYRLDELDNKLQDRVVTIANAMIDLRSDMNREIGLATNPDIQRIQDNNNESLIKSLSKHTDKLNEDAGVDPSNK